MAFALLENGIVTSVVDQIPAGFSGGSVDVGSNTDVIGWKIDGNILNNGSLDCLIYNFIPNYVGDKKIPPYDVDFLTSLTIKLHRKQTMIKGEVQTEEYYKDFNGTNYYNIVVREYHVFTRDIMGFATRRTTTVEWALKSGAICPKKKTWKKYYDPLQMIEEGITRRGNIVKFLQPKVISLIMESMPEETETEAMALGRDFLSYMKTDFENFINHSDTALHDTLSGETILSEFPWLVLQPTSLGGDRIVDHILAEVTI
jgi:hypothetical protein